MTLASVRDRVHPAGGNDDDHHDAQGKRKMGIPNHHVKKVRASLAHQPAWQRFQAVSSLSAGLISAPKTSQQQQQQVPHHPYQRQYAHVYHQRLAQLGPRCWQSVDHFVKLRLSSSKADDDDDDDEVEDQEESGSIQRVTRILELQEQIPLESTAGGGGEENDAHPKSVLQAVVGTLVKERQPLHEDDKKNAASLLHPQSACRSSDVLYLEDDSGRVALQFDSKEFASNFSSPPSMTGDVMEQLQLQPHGYSTGMVVAVLGQVQRGVLQVDHILGPRPPSLSSPPAAAPPSAEAEISPPPCVLLLSGLFCGDAHTSSLTRDLLLTFVQGHFPSCRDKAASIAHIVIAGGLVAPTPASSTTHHHSTKSASSKIAGSEAAERVAALRDVDVFLWQLAQTGISLDVLPGKDDPTTANWPQRPLHRSLWPRTHAHFGPPRSAAAGRAAPRGWVHAAPNPYAAWIQHQYVVGTDGTNLRDLTQQVLLQSSPPPVGPEDPPRHHNNEEAPEDAKSQPEPWSSWQPLSELQALHRTLWAGHVCPTGPDSVPTVPHAERDPMVLEHWPHLYFGGQASAFGTELVELKDDLEGTRKCRLVCIPCFAQTGEAVLVNMETLDVELLQFQE